MRRGFAIGVVALAGCMHVTFARTGVNFPARDHDCPVDYDYDDGKAMTMIDAGYVEVATATIGNAGKTWNDKMRDEVGPKTCEYGGDVALMNCASMNVVR